MTDKRLIEVAFPLREASIDSVHEKNVRHGHISTLHIWPARRPLAACRAALIATLLPDPGDDEERNALLKRLGGTLRKTTKKKKMPNGRVEEIDALETEGGVLHWGRESGPDMDWFREEIRNAYGGRAPRVLDPFAGGGAIPLEAMRLGCEVTAADINPVAWFILKCTLEYPQRLAGQTRRLPDFALEDPDFMAAYLKAKGLKPAEIKRYLPLRNLPSPASGRGGGGEGGDEGVSEAKKPRPPRSVPPDLLRHAREMRSEATDAEKLMWYLLRNRRLADARFRRQHPIGRYIVDFCCREYGLVVELDGGQHRDQQTYDARRDAFLRKQGLSVLRFWNNDVLSETEGVLQQIWEFIEKAKDPSPPTPLPLAGEGSLQRGETGDLFGHPALSEDLLDADLAWHVRAWGRWVLKQARRDLARFYPTYAEYCTLKPYRVVPLDHGEPLRLVPTNDDGEPQMDLLNAGFDADYLEYPTNPRWVAKPTVAYLWARTVRCKACRATVPLLKTRWLAKKDNKRVLLTMRPNDDGTGVVFGINANVPQHRGNAAQRREHDKRIGVGTMSRAGASCPCCPTIMTSEDLRLESLAGRFGEVMTGVVVDGPDGKEYRLPTNLDLDVTARAKTELTAYFDGIPFSAPTESIPLGGSRQAGGSPFTTPLYGLDQWIKLFTPRQSISLAVLVKHTRNLKCQPEFLQYRDSIQEALFGLLATAISKVADRGSSLCTWTIDRITIRNTFARFALSISWDFAESVPVVDASGGYPGAIEWAADYLEHTAKFATTAPIPRVIKNSAVTGKEVGYDVLLTDPPYYDAIPYSDLMDFFYVWLRRTLHGLSPELDRAFVEPLSPKWNHDANDGELIDDSSRFGGDKEASKRNYEAGMARAFGACHGALSPDGRLVVVFAHKHPDAWETLVAAIIRAGFVVDGSWPIQTEIRNRTRALSSAALSSSVWLVCRKRDPKVRPGWDTAVLKEMEGNIIQRLRAFWDAGIRGPDFVWAATGPALESYSRYPVVKKASATGGAVMDVGEFLGHVRRIVVDFVVGRVLTHGEAEPEVGDHPLDDVTTYYLLHRSDFGLKEAPAGPCILYAISCGLSERELVDQYGLLARGKAGSAADIELEGDADEDAETEDAGGSSGGKLKLKPWKARTPRGLGDEPVRGRAIPLIDHVHRLLQLWGAADVVKVNAHLDRHGLRRSHLFAQLIQALIEQSRSEGAAEECAALERLANHLKGFGSAGQGALALGD
jgi:adenine-specific DNA methylase/very-short-patch-repair endonuclease